MTFNLRLMMAILITMILSIFPLPEVVSGLRPPVMLLLSLYIQCFIPVYFYVWVLFFIGLCMDVLSSTLIGQHVFALLAVSWIVNSKARRFRFFPVGQQFVLTGIFCLIYQAALLLVDVISGFNYSFIMAIISAVIGMFCWPWIKILADDTLLLKLSR